MSVSDVFMPSVEMAYSSPDAKGFFGPYGGTFVPETVEPALAALEDAFHAALADPAFHEEFTSLLRDYVGRPSPLYRADRLADAVGLGRVYLKREDLNHTGAHKINNTIGQCLLARRMGKQRVIAETGAGQHGVATATGAALMGLECAVFMGTEDIRRQSLNVYKMRLLGAEVVPVSEGTGTLADAVTAALNHWVDRVDDTFYVLGSAVGPHPYPALVREFQKVIGEETLVQLQAHEERLPDAVIACIGGGSNAIGMFYPFLRDVPADKRPRMFGAEAAGLGVETGKHGAALTQGAPGTLHGFYSYMLQDDEGNPVEAYSISAGLDYPGVGPEHSYLKDEGLVCYEAVTDAEALEAFALLTRTEGIIPAIESSHALALLPRLAPELGPDAVVVVNVSGRGDKDMDIVREAGLGID